MADFCGPIRLSDSWSSTEVKSISHTHMWTIKGFSQCEVRYLETTVRIKDSANSNAASTQSDQANGIATSSQVFRIRLHPQGNKESNKDFCFFQVFSCSNVSKFKAKFSVFNTRNEEIPATVYTGTQQLNGYFEYLRRDLLISHIQPQDEIHLMLSLNIASDTVTKSSQTVTAHALPEPRPAEVAHDMEIFFSNERFSDFRIICKEAASREENDGREPKVQVIPVHKVVLAARSPVFAAMFEPHTEEAKNGQVVVSDIDYEVLREFLLFMYSGRAPTLQVMALELLVVADRYQVNGLKEMADAVLRQSLTSENACRILIDADMHSASELKSDAIKFIAQNSSSIIETEGWANLLKSHATLVTEVVGAMSNDLTRTGEPSAKRGRYDC